MADIKAEIQAQMKKMEEAMLAGKQDEMVNFYTDDCRVLPAGAPMLVGKDALRGFLAIMAQFMEKVGKVENIAVDAVSMGELASSVNASVVYDKDGKVFDNNKSISLWKKVDGNWLVHWTAWSSDQPTPSQ
ncbi:Hypothetical predicted protein [Paramuricea clavata]|uniref:Uncharacterized protein n=1 Tax=Paramuricea clavata TaxID=317549 RepID=A0A6S7FIX8_PARCT|nr:Hypothetical predicted protein [Paramuricea clavata]